MRSSVQNVAMLPWSMNAQVSITSSLHSDFIFTSTMDRIHSPLLAPVTPLIPCSVNTKALVTSMVTSVSISSLFSGMTGNSFTTWILGCFAGHWHYILFLQSLLRWPWVRQPKQRPFKLRNLNLSLGVCSFILLQDSGAWLFWQNKQGLWNASAGLIEMGLFSWRPWALCSQTGETLVSKLLLLELTSKMSPNSGWLAIFAHQLMHCE